MGITVCSFHHRNCDRRVPVDKITQYLGGLCSLETIRYHACLTTIRFLCYPLRHLFSQKLLHIFYIFPNPNVYHLPLLAAIFLFVNSLCLLSLRIHFFKSLNLFHQIAI